MKREDTGGGGRREGGGGGREGEEGGRGEAGDGDSLLRELPEVVVIALIDVLQDSLIAQFTVPGVHGEHHRVHKLEGERVCN